VKKVWAPICPYESGLHDAHVIRVRVRGNRELVFSEVLVRFLRDYRLAMHLDTDEANAAGIAGNLTGWIEAVQTRN
jgi:acetate kinase